MGPSRWLRACGTLRRKVRLAPGIHLPPLLDTLRAASTLIGSCGGHGSGKAYARGLGREGAAVVIAELDGDAARAVADELSGDGFRALGVRTDVADAASVEAMARHAVEAFGRIDILVNNAAIFATIPMSRAPFDEFHPAEWDRMMTVNLKGTWLPCPPVIPPIRRPA